MKLGELISFLESQDQDLLLPKAFCSPHSYRGYYCDLGLVPIEYWTVGQILEVVKDALGSTYSGWKGGDYVMHEGVDCYLAHVGDTGIEISPLLMEGLIAIAELEKLKVESMK